MTIQKNYPDKKEDYLLSIVICGRNDNYMGDFKYRITTCINFLARSAAVINRLCDIELIVVDWNSEVPLHEVLSLTKEAEEITKFVIIPPDTASKYNKTGLSFHASCAPNIGIRRSNGNYIMAMPADILVTAISLQNLLLLLEEKIVPAFDIENTSLHIGRRMIPWQFVQGKPGLDEWERYLQLHSFNLRGCDGGPGIGSGLGAYVLSRKIWHSTQAFLEELGGWGWADTEFDLRSSQRYPSVVLSYFGIVFFDMDQEPKKREILKKFINPEPVSFFSEARNPDWGLRGHALEIKKSSYKNDVKNDLNADVGSITGKNEVSGGLIAELTVHTVREHVLSLVNKWMNFKDSVIRWLNSNAAGWEIMYALSWYSIYHYPRTYIEFGINRAYVSTIVAAACSSVEIYAIDDLQPKGRSHPAPDPFYMNLLFSQVGYRGYMRFISGDMSTAFQRLKDSSIGPLSFDLALVHGDMLGSDTIRQLSDILPHLASGGMLVYTACSAESLQNDWQHIQKLFPQFTYVMCKSGMTGLIMTASLFNNDVGVLPVGENGFQVDFGKAPRSPLRFRGIHYRVYQALRIPSRYPEYSKRILKRCFRI